MKRSGMWIQRSSPRQRCSFCRMKPVWEQRSRRKISMGTPFPTVPKRRRRRWRLLYKKKNERLVQPWSCRDTRWNMAGRRSARLRLSRWQQPRRTTAPSRALQSATFQVYDQGRSQEFATGGQKRRLGNGSPPVGSRGRAPVGVYGEAPKAGDRC